jgi:hypothetical protein
MRRRQYFLTVAALALFGDVSYGTVQKPVPSPAQACSVLKRAAITFHLSRRNLSGRYYCDSLGDVSDYYLLGLRYRLAKDENVGSNLIGWFAVRRSDGAVLDWDIDQDQAMPLASRPPFER